MFEKKGDPGRPIIPIHIGANTFDEAIYDLGASVNIMPRVIYAKIKGEPLLYTTMCLQLVDQTLYPKGILENVHVRVGHSFLEVDFVVIEIGEDDRAPIILGSPFLSSAKAIIYADSAKICFTIGSTKERFSFKKRTNTNRVHPQCQYDYEIREEKIKNLEKKILEIKNVYTYEGVLPTSSKREQQEEGQGQATYLRTSLDGQHS